MKTQRFPDEDTVARFDKGEELFAHRYMGAHCFSINGIGGVHFAVWAPNAKSVALVGDFNQWQENRNFLQPLGTTGIWQIFVAGLGPGALYKYAVQSQKGEIFLKADPFAFAAEIRPRTASIVTKLDNYIWDDEKWLRARKQKPFRGRPINIYELHLGSWKRKENGDFLSYRELADSLIPYVKEMGYTHVEFMPLMEHPFDGSWGYQITGYFAATSRYGPPQELMLLIDRLHQAGIGVILDWVPGHFCKDSHGLSNFDGTRLFEKEDHAEWGTSTFNFANKGIWSFLLSNAIFWLEVFHADGFRVDGVSSMLYLNYGRKGKPRQNSLGGEGDLDAIAFIQALNERVLSLYPDVLMTAEESSAWPLVTYPPYDGGLGFHYKWNMGWMNDTLRYMAMEFPKRTENHHLLTFSMVYAFSENYILPFSHDEVVHGKKSLIGRMQGDYEDRFAGLRLLFCYQFTHPGAKLSFMGNEFGQFIEWKFEESLDWVLLTYEKHKEMQRFSRCLHKLYLTERCLWEKDDGWDGFQWLDADNKEQGILIFARRSKAEDECVLVVLNFQPQAYSEFWLGVPAPGIYWEIFNSDGKTFGGEGHSNPQKMRTEPHSCHGQENAIKIILPPLGGILIKGKFEKNKEGFHV